MTAFNVVRFRGKSGEEERYLEAFRSENPSFAGYRGGALIKTGERAYCFTDVATRRLSLERICSAPGVLTTAPRSSRRSLARSPQARRGSELYRRAGRPRSSSSRSRTRWRGSPGP